MRGRKRREGKQHTCDRLSAGAIAHTGENIPAAEREISRDYLCCRYDAIRKLRRVYPVPFRFLDGNSQFTKWEWISARLARAAADQRPESHRIDVDTVRKLSENVSSADGWARRLALIEPHVFDDFGALEQRRLKTGETLGFVRPSRLVSLELTPQQNSDWTPEELEKLTQERLFESVENRPPTLRKLGHDFHYRYECATPDGPKQYRHMITDWEAGVLYLNCVKKYGSSWEEKLRQKLEMEFAAKNLILMMGTMHRFPDQWLIIGLIYPPKQPPRKQLALEL